MPTAEDHNRAKQLPESFVVEVGERQGWLFVAFCDNRSNPPAEYRLYMDGSFILTGVTEVDVQVLEWLPLIRLAKLQGLTVRAVEVGPADRISIHFDNDVCLKIEGKPSSAANADVWWFGQAGKPPAQRRS